MFFQGETFEYILTGTPRYNARSHPMPFMQAGGVAPAAKAAPKEVPDLEEAIEESDDAEVLIDPAKEEDDDAEVDLSKDKYIRKPKKKAAPKKPAAKKAKKEVGSDEEPKPKSKALAKRAPAKNKTKK